MATPKNLIDEAVQRFSRKFYFAYPKREATEEDIREGWEPTGKKLKGYVGSCTACGAVFDHDRELPKKNERIPVVYGCGAQRAVEREIAERKFVTCPQCGETLEVKKGWYGRKTLKDRFYLQAWEIADYNRVVLHECIVFCEDWTHNEPEYVAAFELRSTELTPGKCVTIKWNGVEMRKAATCTDYQRSGRTLNPFGSPISIEWGCPKEYFLNHGDLRRSFLKPLYDACERQMIEPAALADYVIRMNEEPITEFAFKAGFVTLAENRVYKSRQGHGTPHINFAARSPKKMFRGLGKNNALNKAKQLMKLVEPRRVSIMSLEWGLQRFTKTNDRPEDIAPLVSSGNAMRIRREIIEMLPKFSTKRISEYINKDGRFLHYRDYLMACIDVGAPLNEAKTAFPEDLSKAHDEMFRRRKMLLEKETIERCRKRHDKLAPVYEYKHKGVAAIVPETPQDIVMEGEKLDHCVAGYAKDHAAGLTTIIFIRRESDLGAQWYTLEIEPKTGRFLQCYGYHNKTTGIWQKDGKNINYDREVGQFLYHYKRHLKWARAHSKQMKKFKEDLKCRKKTA